jgi:hypothetical protein
LIDYTNQGTNSLIHYTNEGTNSIKHYTEYGISELISQSKQIAAQSALFFSQMNLPKRQAQQQQYDDTTDPTMILILGMGVLAVGSVALSSKI